jgi:hypothetical protein
MSLTAKQIDQERQSSFEDLRAVSLDVLDQLTSEIKTLNPSQYVYTPHKNCSPISAHMRHVIEFYQALFTFLECNSPIDLCYDDRARDPNIEAQKEIGLKALSTVKLQLQNLECMDNSVTLKSVICPDLPYLKTQTTIQRELFYLLDHTIHHMALIKERAEAQNISLDKDFGRAQSTKAYEQGLE